MKLLMDIANTKITYSEQEVKNGLQKSVDKLLRETLGARQKGYQYAPAFKSGYWDGLVTVFDKENQQFPTGLIDEVDKALGKLQNIYGFEYSIVDDRPEPFVEEQDVPKEISFSEQGNNISLRDYQMRAVHAVFDNVSCVVKGATGMGKCLSKNTDILTNRGYKSFEQILHMSGLELDSPEGVYPNKSGLKVVNRYGELEEATEITINGVKPLKRITFHTGATLELTHNHPLLVVTSDGSFAWREGKDLRKDDYVVHSKGSNIFGGSSKIKNKNEAYLLGVAIADGGFSIKNSIIITNNEPEIISLIEDYAQNRGFTFRKRTKEGQGDPDKPSYDCVLYNKIEKNFYDYYGIKHGLARDKEVPQAILGAPRHIQVAFLSGYFECVGHVAKGARTITAISASEKLLRQLSLMLLNLGVASTVREKVVKGYEHNWYGRMTVSSDELDTLLGILEFRTAYVKERVANLIAYRDSKKHQSYDIVPNGKLVSATYKTLYNGDKKGIGRKYSVTRGISKPRFRRMMGEYPIGSEHMSKYNELLSDNYHYSQILSIEDIEPAPTYDFHVPKTHSFIANGVVNHNTIVGAGTFQTLLPHLEKDEILVFFTSSKEIFAQVVERLEENLDMKIGQYASNKKDIQKVTVAMIQTVNSGLTVDPEKGVKFNPKEMVIKKMVKNICPTFEKGVNQKQLLINYQNNFKIKTKADEKFNHELEKLIWESGSDKEIVLKLKGYQAQYQEILKAKNKKKLKKRKDTEKFLNRIVGFISDEHHHVVSDSTYRVLLNCKNAIYRVGLSGSIDPKDELLKLRMKAVTGDIQVEVLADEMIERGILAKPEMIITPIHKVLLKNNEIDLTKENDYAKVYDNGIVLNEYRNNLIAKITEMCYHKDKGILIIVNRIQQGNIISDMLSELNVPHEFLTGEHEDDHRKEQLQAMKDGNLKVMIATAIMDEGVDISGIDVLVLGAGGKSLRQTIQRVGRSLRKKKTGENKARIYDFDDRTNKHLFNHSKARRKIYADEKFDITFIGK